MISEENRIALVTGGSRGLGKDMAISLAKEGADVIITYHNNREKANDVVNEIRTLGKKAHSLQLDTRDVQQFDSFIDQLSQVLKDKMDSSNFHYLINNAGTALHAAFADTSEEQFDDMINIHFKGVLFLTQKSLPLIKDGGRIINISSGLARFSLPGYSVYGSVKGAIEVLTRYQAKELGSRGITVNAVAPGAIETDFGGGHVRDNKELNQMVSNMTALGRAGKPGDIGGVVAFLCSEEAAWINGQRIEVSGGMNL